MSNRTPGLQARSQFHAYWGQYAWNAAGSDAGAANLPNDTANALPQPYFSQLEVGDTASTTDASVANRGLWVCVSTGTVGGADAQWRRLDNGTANVQTIRDAHVIVVAQDGQLATLGALVDPNKAANNFNLSAAGDVVSITCDYLDPGDGTELEKALLVAAAAGTGIDVRLRPCTLTLAQASLTALPLVVPQQCRLIGGGRWISIVQSDFVANASQEIFQLDPDAELIDLGVNSGNSAGTPSVVVSKAMVACISNNHIERCAMEMAGVARAQPWAIWDPSGTVEVLDMEMFGSAQTNGTTPSIGVLLGNPDSANSYAQNSTYRITDVLMDSGKDGGFNKAVLAYNVGAGRISACDFRGIVRPQFGAIQFAWAGAPLIIGGGGLRDVVGCVTDVRIEITNDETALDNPYVGVAVTNQMAIDSSVGYFEWTAIRVLFDPPADQDVLTIARAGYVVRSATTADQASDVQIEGGIINGCSVLGSFCLGVLIHADGTLGGTAAASQNIRIGDGIFKNPIVLQGSADGIQLKTFTTIDTIKVIGISNCDCTNTPATGVGIEITKFAGSTLDNTIVVGNHLTPNGGTALVDTGTGTEAGHNIL